MTDVRVFLGIFLNLSKIRPNRCRPVSARHSGIF